MKDSTAGHSLKCIDENTKSSKPGQRNDQVHCNMTLVMILGEETF